MNWMSVMIKVSVLLVAAATCLSGCREKEKDSVGTWLDGQVARMRAANQASAARMTLEELDEKAVEALERIVDGSRVMLERFLSPTNSSISTDVKEAYRRKSIEVFEKTLERECRALRSSDVKVSFRARKALDAIRAEKDKYDRLQIR